MSEQDRLRRAIRDLHGCESNFVRSEHVRETFEGQGVWEGDVEVFALVGHPRATMAYAWAHETDEGGRRFVAVLALPPVKTATDAVRASIAADYKSQPRR
jgi:hypothetical protein